MNKKIMFIPVRKEKEVLCYLCGGPISCSKSRDHWPPAQFFPSALRKRHKPSKLITIPAHFECNKKYQPDEDYFFVSLGCLIEDPYVRGGIFRDLKRKFKELQRQALFHQVKKEFVAKTDGGIYFPAPKLGKKFDLERIENVIWKITRGLYFVGTNTPLPENVKRYIRIMDPQQSHPENVTSIFERVKSQEERGEYGRIFSYKVLKSDPNGIYAVGYLFWNQIMFLVIFHGPECMCSDCVKMETVNE